MLQVLMREEFSDLNLVVGRNLIAVHQLVLGAHSSQVALVFSSVAEPIRIHVFLGLLDPDPDPLVRGMDPDPSIIKQKW
jgi:hypothetical protein